MLWKNEAVDIRGGHSFIEYYDFCTDYWKQAKICAILDNDREKWGMNIREIIVVSPEYILDYDYDIETRRLFFEKFIFPWYKKRLEDKKILVVGEKFRFDAMHQAYCDFFKIIGFVSLDEIDLISTYNYDYVLLTSYQMEKDMQIRNFC